MRGYQASFASGEISPLLHGRIDLTRYATGLSKLENMIVLPQGGVTRRAGFTKAGVSVTNAGVRLIPFVYNATDSAMLEFGNKHIRVWSKSGTGYAIVSTLSSPYTYAEAVDLRYVQSGNVIFLAHMNHKPMMLTRRGISSWVLEEMPYHDGPFISGQEMYYGVELMVRVYVEELEDGTRKIQKYIDSSRSIFNTGMAGMLIKGEYVVDAQTISFTAGAEEESSGEFPVKGTMNISTSGNWSGTVNVYRNELLLRQYERINPETQGQWDCTISETEDDVYYEVRATGCREYGEFSYDTQAMLSFDVGAITSAMHSVASAVRAVEGAVSKISDGVYITQEEEAYNKIIDEGINNYKAFTDDGARVFRGYTYEIQVLPGGIERYVCVETGETSLKDTAERAEKNARIEAAESVFGSSSGGGGGGGGGGMNGSSTGTITRTSSESGEVTVVISVSGFLKAETYKIKAVKSGTRVEVEANNKDREGENKLRFWSIGAWGATYGYPRAVSMYHDRLVFAGSKAQPQTIWMSKTGDYANFGTSDPLRDDDAINITLAGTSSDGIHSLVSAGSLLAFTRSGEWNIKGSGESGAVTPTGIAAYEQSKIGSKSIQPLAVNGKIIMIQAQGQKVYALGYDLNTDGYTGSELSIMSGHIFEDKEINSLAYQQTPDSLLWFSLSDGTAAVCTYNPEHEVIGWSRHNNPEIRFRAFSCIPGGKHTELFSEAIKDSVSVIMVSRNRTEEGDYSDDGVEYESVMQTLRVTGSNEGGVSYASKKLISRLVVYGLESKVAWAAPKDWERRQKIRWEETDEIELREAELELDNGFDTDACIQIRNAGNERLTIAAISPVITIGG